MATKTRRKFSSRFYLIAILSFLFLLDAFALWLAAKLDYDRTIDRAQITLQRTSISLEERVKRTLIATETILHNQAERIRQAGLEEIVSSAHEWEEFRRAAQSLPDAGSLWLLDDKANLLMDSTEYPSPRMNFSEREYFVPQRDMGIELYIGPVVKGRITQKYSFTISHRISGKHGEFLGIVLAAIETDDFTDFLRNIDIGKGSTVTVFRTDGALILRQPMQDEYLQKNFSHLKLFSMPLDTSPSGIFESPTMDGVVRLISYRKVQGQPLLVTTGIPVDSVLEGWWTRLRSYSIGAVLICLVLIALTLLVRKTTLREQRERTRELSEINQSLMDEMAERREAEEEVARTNQRLTRVLDSIQDDFYVLDRDWNFVYANRQFTSKVGKEPEDFIGNNIWEMFPRHLGTVIDESYHATMEKREVRRFEMPGKYTDAWYSMTSFPSPEGITVLGTDITARRRAEEALQRYHDDLEQRVRERTESLRRQAELLELAYNAVVVRDLESRITFWNTRAEELYGWTKEEALGNVSHDLLKTEFPVPFEDYIAVLTREGRWEGELVHTRKDGRKITVASRHALQRDENAKPLAILEIDLDITASRRLETQLRQAQKMEALGTLSGGIAHDFNNILAAIIGFTDLVADHLPKGGRDARHLGRVMEASLRGRELVRQMLTFSKRTEQEKKPLRLSSIVDETIKLIRATTPTTVNIRVNTETESGAILGDPTQIQQILMNLCTNATHAMREKGGVLDIELCDSSVSPSDGTIHDIKPGLYTKLVVRDNGTGISPDVIDKIFDPFFTTKKFGEGTGLGLSVVHGIVKQCDGYITVESEIDKSTTFTVYFPKTGADAETAAISDDAIATGTERILFVDDEDALAEIGEDILSELGYEVTSRRSSREALALVKEDPTRFDLVITDQTMPDMTGIELTREILDLRSNMPIIMCTGFSHLVDAEKAKAMGIKAFAMKPLTKKEIARTIRQALDE